MPATEQTWRDQKLMHVVFAISSVLLLLSTIWMFAADHDRPWKDHQIEFRNAELRLIEMRKLQVQSDDVVTRHEQLSAEMTALRSQPLDESVLAAFWNEVADHPKEMSRKSAYDSAKAEFDAAVAHAGVMRNGGTLDGQEITGYNPSRAKADDLARQLGAKKKELEAAEAAVKEAKKEKTPDNPDEAKKGVADAQAVVDGLQATLAAMSEELQAAEQAAADAKSELISAEVSVGPKRDAVLNALKKVIRVARVDEENALQTKKFRSAKYDAAKANEGLGVRDSYPSDIMDDLQAKSEQLKEEVQQLTVAWQAASQHRQNLQKHIDQLTRDESEKAKELEANEKDLKTLQIASIERRSTFFTDQVPFLGKKWLELPILDAFNSPLKIDNLWSEGLDHKYGSFSRVRRFDRCTTCHQAIQKTMPGSAIEPGVPHGHDIDLVLSAPNQEKLEDVERRLNDPTIKTGEQLEKRLEFTYGVGLALEGLLKKEDVTVEFIRAGSLAAEAVVETTDLQLKDGDQLRLGLLQPENAVDRERPGLLVGDMIVAINGSPMTDRERTINRLLEAASAGEELVVTVNRGLRHPYASHPRLDLFIGSLSPHKMADFACTVCHDGQGSATAFKWASHTPNSGRQREDWQRDYGWFDNHHWIYPMPASRFVESSCLKCHHDIYSLAASEKFPEPPAPKLSHGYDLIRRFGCFGCHEINGYDGPDKRVGPDLRVEPNYFAAAQQLMGADGTGFEKLTAEEQEWVKTLVKHPERDDVRHRIHSMIVVDSAADEPRMSKLVHKTLEPLFKDVEAAGQVRKVGPSLRYVGSKLDSAFVFDWVRQPNHFRPGTRMPQFFGLWDHLPRESMTEEKHHLEAQKKQLEKSRRPNTAKIAEIDAEIARLDVKLATLEEDEKRYEPAEIYSMTSFLMRRSQDFAYLKPAKVDESSHEDMVARGKIQFQERGCLACHQHKDFPDADAFNSPSYVQQGPDLSGIGDKLSPERTGNENGRRWLYSWIRQPDRYHVRTLMPDLDLDPYEHKDENGNVTGTTDPVADIAEYLLSSKTGWVPQAGTISADDELTEKDLRDLALEHLKDAFYDATAIHYLEKGIPERIRSELKGAESELVVPDAQYDDPSAKISRDQLLLYVGRKSIGKYGCYACHDIPGFEDAKPIGTGLADWGVKETSKLAFEHIGEYLGHHAGGHGDEHADEHEADDSLPEYFLDQLNSGNRVGFLYQKLREPRGYDYHKTASKKYNERLRMPEFGLSHEQREAVMTFVLGLVADPPSAKFVYQPDERAEALIAGREVIAKYNCGGCHMFDTEKWQVAFPPGAIPSVGSPSTYPFLLTKYSPEDVKASATPDHSNLLHATLSGMPLLYERDGMPRVHDSEGDLTTETKNGKFAPSTVSYDFELWKPALIEGNVFEVDSVISEIRHSWIEKKQRASGGYLTKYLLSHVTDRAVNGEPLMSRIKNVNAKGTDAWAWLPPPLIDEGTKVQSAWLHDFLLDPYPIRPAVLLRMPKFNMSPAEATKLVNYFSARDNAEYPYQFDARSSDDQLAAAEEQYQSLLADLSQSGSRFDDAMKILTDKKSGCVQCHEIADYSVSPKAPNLAAVHRRLRRDYLRRWIAKPVNILPYTTMQENVKYVPDSPEDDGFIVIKEGAKLKYFHGTSTEQLDGLVDLLMNYDKFTQQRTSITDLVKLNSPEDESADETPADATPTADTPAETNEDN